MHQEHLDVLAGAGSDLHASASAAAAPVGPNVGSLNWPRLGANLGGVSRRIIVSISLSAGDLAAIFAASSVAQTALHLIFRQPQASLHLLPVWLVAVYGVLGLYNSAGPSPYERFRLRAIGIAIYLAIDFLLALGGRIDLDWPVLVLFLGTCLLIFGHYIELGLRGLLIRWRLWGAPTILVGCDDRNNDLARKLRAEPELGLHPVGFLQTPEDTPEMIGRAELPVVGQVGDAAKLGASIEVAIFNSTRHLSKAVKRDRSRFTRVFVVEDAQDMQSLWLRTRTLCGAVGIEIRRDLYLPQNLYLKRAVDLLIAVPAGILCLPVVLLLALGIKLVDPGPAFYVQVRVGRNGCPLPVYKLRSMRRDAERRLEEHLKNNPAARAEWSRYFKLADDPRILPRLGNLIRRTSLDELPQLWNIIRGDMSVVGPRPLPRYHTSSFDAEFQAVRESVPPGLTGLWQISARSDGDLTVQRAQDLFYIRNWSVWLDMYIIVQTLPAVLSGKGAK